MTGLWSTFLSATDVHAAPLRVLKNWQDRGACLSLASCQGSCRSSFPFSQLLFLPKAGGCAMLRFPSLVVNLRLPLIAWSTLLTWTLVPSTFSPFGTLLKEKSGDEPSPETFLWA